MIKVKTFKAGDKKIDAFLEKVAIIHNGIQTHGDNVTFLYRDEKFMQFGDEEVLATLYQNLFTEKQELLKNKLELKLFERRDPEDEHHGRDLASLKSKKVKTEISIEVTEKIIEELA